MTTRMFGPLAADHPLVTDGTRCLVCDGKFVPGHMLTLKAIEPGDDEERAKMDAGRPYTALAAPIHAGCNLT